MEIKFKKVHTKKDLIISSIVLAAGIGLYFVNAGLGILLAACGVLMLLFYKDGYKREGEGIVLQKKALDVAHSCRDSLKGFLEVFYNAAASVAYAQLFDFSNYTYEPATDLVEVRGPKADKLISKL